MKFVSTSTLSPAVRRSRRGFTLIELLTVIAIIGILAAIIIPTVGRVRASARQTQGLSNLRQIGTAAELYASENRNLLPVASSAVSNFGLTLRPYLAQKGEKYADNTVPSPIFKDPAAKIDGGTNHFSANPNFMPDTGSAGSVAADAARRSRSLAKQPSRQVLIADGSQMNAGNAMTTLYGYSWMYTAASAASDTPVPRNADDDTVAGRLSWRSADSSGVKCLWVDGHVSVMREGQLLRRNFQRD